MAQGPWLSPATFQFFRELEVNNDRTWFTQNKLRYEREVRDPMFSLIRDFAPTLHAISPHFEAEARPVGGSLFRIQRDTRFSPDKRPYKTHTAAQFRHNRGKDVHAPGFYLHVQPGHVYAGVGLWHPEKEPLEDIRQAILRDPEGWGRARHGLELGGESLSRPPRGYPTDFTYVEDLKRKDFICGQELGEEVALSPQLVERMGEFFRRASPFMAFLCGALKLEY